MKWILTVCLCLLTAGCSSFSKNKGTSNSSNTPEIIPLAGSFQVHRYSFNNGLRLLVLEDHTSPTFAYQTWFRVGSRDETPGKTGLAHLFEHMMFKETKTMKEGEFDRLLEGAGAEGENAFTSRDYTAYIQQLPKNKLEMIVKAESDRMMNLVINENAFKTEREVVQNERRFRNENNPDGLLDQQLFHLAYTQHPYHWPIIGYEKDLAQMSHKDALEFYRSHYGPNHATIVVVGDVDPDEVHKWVQKYYGDLPKAEKVDHTITPEPKQKAPRKKQLKLNIQVEKILMAYPIPAFNHEDTPTLEVLQNILTESKSSRLNRALVNSGIATNVETENLDSKDPSLFLIFSNLQKGKRADQAETVILHELSRLSQELVSNQELERVKNKLSSAFYQSLGSNFEKAIFLGQNDSVGGDFRIGLEHHRKMQQVSAEDIRNVVRRYFNPHSRTVVTGVAKGVVK